MADGVSKNVFKGILTNGTFSVSKENPSTVLNRLSNSYFSMPNNQAYGQWEFEVYKINNTGILDFAIGGVPLTTTNQCYVVAVNDTHQIVFKKYVGTTLTTLFTSTATITLSAWNKIKIQRKFNNEFMIYLNDVLLTTITDSSITATNFIMLYSTSASSKWKNIRAYPSITV
jgi:hypothetical protein